MSLQHFAKDIWINSVDHRMFGLHIGSRMTVVRLSGGGLLLHSPVALSQALRAELDALGPVTHIVCPNLFHHLYAGDAVAAYPNAMLHGPQQLRRKRPDLNFNADLSDTAHADWKDDLVPLTIQGCLLCETVFFHTASRTLISSDLVENFSTSSHWPTLMYLKLTRMQGRATWNPPLRFFYRDRVVARACIDRILEWPFEKMILAHGEVIVADARDSVRRGMAWLQ